MRLRRLRLGISVITTGLAVLTRPPTGCPCRGVPVPLLRGVAGDSLLAKVLKEKFNYILLPEHVLYFSPQTLKQMLEKVGFRVIKTTTYGYAQDVGIMYRALREKYSKTKKRKDTPVSKTVSQEVAPNAQQPIKKNLK